MGCCGSKEEEQFESREPLLKGKKLSEKVESASVRKPLAPPNGVAKTPVIDNGSERRKSTEEVHPTVESVDLLGLDQPPSPPQGNTPEKEAMFSPHHVLPSPSLDSPLMPPRPTSPPTPVKQAMSFRTAPASPKTSTVEETDEGDGEDVEAAEPTPAVGGSTPSKSKSKKKKKKGKK
ncbi:hypothetical protein Poli38472_001050 [Pythium oligandrum]|uniref:Uncharacterized protein n=1 Tax=Pythium oligandrum TaxID=41045 RepID=A0A8K1FQ01_PYTOL|nr:hypothetical protein Poli38472_001050 [Pythium oligandrum]|eukprot:TMW68894.1 hypothetical protein Poli38472_001050 [Pythium oligandrum]